MNALTKAENKMQAEMDKWIDLIYGATAIVLKRYWGYGVKRTQATMDEVSSAWEECADTNEKSMIQMLEEETGIEIRNHEQGKGWRELAFLNADIKVDPNKMTRMQWIVMRQHQAQWMKQQIVACTLLALHRRFEFGTDRLIRVAGQIEDVVREFGENRKLLLKAAYDEAGFTVKGVRG